MGLGFRDISLVENAEETDPEIRTRMILWVYRKLRVRSQRMINILLRSFLV